MTLLEVIIAATCLSVIFFGALIVLNGQVDVIGYIANNDFTVAPAQSALWKIRDALESAVQNPQGITNAVAPVYAVTSPAGGFSSIVWRPTIGFLSPADPNYATASANGCISTNNVQYDLTAQKLWVDTSNAPVNILKLDTVSGSTGGTVVRSIPLLGNVSTGQTVTEFRLYNAESTDSFYYNVVNNPVYAPGADVNTWLIGVYVRVEHVSMNPNEKGAVATSNYYNDTASVNDLRMAVLVQPETLTNTSGKPFVGP
jgi:hypothetical protein